MSVDLDRHDRQNLTLVLVGIALFAVSLAAAVHNFDRPSLDVCARRGGYWAPWPLAFVPAWLCLSVPIVRRYRLLVTSRARAWGRLGLVAWFALGVFLAFVLLVVSEISFCFPW